MPFDLDAAIAEYNDIAKKPKVFTFTFDAKKFTLPGAVDAIAVRAAAQGDNLTAFRRLLGEEQYAQIVASPQMLHPLVLEKLMSDYYQHIAGLAAGESSASSRSSKSTAGPSKRTSRASTRRRSSAR